MSDQRGRSAFVPFLTMGALIATVLLCSQAPLFECKPAFIIRKDDMWVRWDCRDCGATKRTSLFRKLFSRETEAPPEDAEAWVDDVFRPPWQPGTMLPRQ